jgi:hypothetical protein
MQMNMNVKCLIVRSLRSAIVPDREGEAVSEYTQASQPNIVRQRQDLAQERQRHRPACRQRPFSDALLRYEDQGGADSSRARL